MRNKKCIISVLLIFSFIQVIAQNDKIYTSNGDVLVGEIKSMKRGVLVYDTDYADSDFQVDWEEIEGIVSTRLLIIYTVDGKKYNGGLNSLPDEPKKITIQTLDDNISVNMDQIVEITSLEQRIIDRIIISIDAGLSYSKANNVRQTSAAAKVSYRGIKWNISAQFNNVGTTQDNVEPLKRTDGGVTLVRDIWGNGMILGGAEFLSNSEQMLDLRSTFRAGLGLYLLRTNHMYMQSGLGLAFSQEKYGGDNPTSQGSFEGLGLFDFNAYDLGDLSFQFKLTTYPSLSDWGRWRIDMDTSLKYDLPLDFYVKLSYVHNFDSDPLVAGVAKNDFVFKTSLGWEWD
ncbi:DUF481 domain-containing protein [Draconibacterium sediminis]|uniref:DUF481 domain-containing protein n=1 Tax=Draconibacterium sediminis TaxID=1544798 RepID=A0A0D8J637_9BACT|nr:DUF481 domain-containing protein [Draconibacterium sediminis]KJF42430.1 hypothetical protein LH29_17820 [Draconibacterium sediminis]